MPEYLAPGVYVEEVAPGPRSIEGVSTSTAGFVGEAERGPTRPTLVTSWQDYTRRFGGYIDGPPFNSANPFLPYAVRGFFDNGGQRVFVARVVGTGATVAGADLNGCIVAANGEGKWGNNVIVWVGPASAVDSNTPNAPTSAWFRLRVAYYRDGLPAMPVDPTDQAQLANPNRVDPTAFEEFDNLSAVSTAANYAMSVVNARSQLIEVTACTARPPDAPFPGTRLQNGAGGTATLTEFEDANQSNPDLRRGLAGLATIRDISLLTAPDESVIGGLRDAVIDACESTRDRFAVTSSDRDVANIADLRPPRDTSYGAFYYPWVRVLAPHIPEGHRLVPANGHLAGIYARIDVERGVHKAPANELVRGIVTRDLKNDAKPLAVTLGKREQDILNPRGVNVIRDFRADGRDIRVWGARTMSSDAMWKYINVRRLFIFIEQSIDRGTQWTVFEPNSEPTWIAIRTSITNFLRTVWRNGALMGITEDEAFFVRCDRSTMTQDDIDNGRLICLIGVAPVKPAEFVIFRISQKTVEAESSGAAAMTNSGSRNDPFSSFNFIVEVGDMRVGFSEVSGLATESGAENIAVREIPGTRKYTNISLKRGYTPDGKDLWNWRTRVMEGKTQRLAGTITLLDEARKPVRTWKFTEGWPSKWTGPALNATSNDIAIEELEISVEGLTLQSS